MNRPALAVGSALAIASTGIACGSELPPAAEPAVSPQADQILGGRIVTLTGEPEGIVADPLTGLVAVSTREPDRLLLIGEKTLEVRRQVSLPAAARHLQLAAPGGPVLVPAERADQLVEVSLPDGATTAATVGDHPHDAAAAAGKVFVSDEFGDTVSVLRGDRRIERLDAPEQPGGIAKVGEGEVAVIAVRERTIRAYDARNLRTIGDADAGIGPTHIVGFGGRAFVADTDGGAILEFRFTPSPEVVGRTNSPGAPYGLAVDSRRRVLWVTLTARNELVSYSLAGGAPERLRAYPTIRQPNSVAVDERTGVVFVAGRRGRELQRIEPKPAENR